MHRRCKGEQVVMCVQPKCCTKGSSTGLRAQSLLVLTGIPCWAFEREEDLEELLHAS